MPLSSVIKKNAHQDTEEIQEAAERKHAENWEEAGKTATENSHVFVATRIYIYIHMLKYIIRI